MILAQNLRLFGKLCWLASSLRILRIAFDSQLKIVRISHDSGNKPWSAVSQFLFIMNVIYTLQCILKTKGTQMESVMSWAFFLLLLLCLIYLHELGRKSVEIQHLLNFLFQLDHILPELYSPKRLSFAIKMNIAFIQCDVMTAIVFPIIVVYGFHWGNPCKASLVGYWLLPKCNSHLELSRFSYPRVLNYAIKLFIFLTNHLIWAISFHTGAFGVCTIQTFCIRTIHQFIVRWEFLLNITIFYKIYIYTRLREFHKHKNNCRLNSEISDTHGAWIRTIGTREGSLVYVDASIWLPIYAMKYSRGLYCLC